MFSLGAGTFGLLCGIILSDRLNIDPNTNKNWINLILPLAIIMLGFGLDINMVLSNQIGVAGLYTIIITIIAAFSCTLLISRVLGIDRLEAFALGAGGAICGNSAVLAVAPSLRLSSKQTGSILAVINILGLATFLSVPLLASAIGFEPKSAGIWAGSTVHAVPQAIAAGEAMGGDALSLASGTKLTRVLGLLIVVPAAIIYSSENGESGNKISSGISRIPLFLPGFILASILSSFLLPETIAQSIEHFGSLLMVPILILIGLSIRPINDKDRIIRPGMSVLDLGSAPGGWSQVAGEWVGVHGRMVASDILPMDTLPDVRFVQGDFTEQETYDRIMAELNNQPLDVVLSDMAPNMSGLTEVDQPRAMYLVELATELARTSLTTGGAFIAKVFQGEGFEAWFREIRGSFTRVVTRKPAASRPRSREVYVVASGFKGGE